MPGSEIRLVVMFTTGKTENTEALLPDLRIFNLVVKSQIDTVRDYQIVTG